MQTTIVPGVATWSQWQPDRNLYFNSWFVESDEGNFVVDPLEPDEPVLAHVAARGLAGVVLTNRDHERAAATFAQRFKVPIIGPAADAPMMGGRVTRTVDDGDLIFGWHIVRFDGMKTPGEFALFRAADRTAITGDAFWGVPAGALTLMADDKLADPERAVLSTRKLLAVNPRHVLVGDGAPIFDRAYDALVAMLEARTGVLFRKINLDELPMRRQKRPGPFSRAWAEAGFPIGAKHLGYAVVQLAPGETGAPFHWHTREEELFLVWDGTPTLRVPAGTFVLRRGDLVAFPPSAQGAHRLSNESAAPCTILMISNIDAGDAGFYPDSRKLFVRSTGTVVAQEPALDYWHGEA